MLLFTFADWFEWVASVVAVVLESEELPKACAAPLILFDMTFRGGALPFRNVLAKLPFAEPGSFKAGWRQ